MKKLTAALGICVLLGAAVTAASAQQPGVATPTPVLRELVTGLPKGDVQEVRVKTAEFQPGDRTVFHSHKFPVTVYVLDGEFTLELEGREPIKVTTGQAMVEPPHVKMTGYNRSLEKRLKVVIFYVSDKETPFLDPAHH